MRYRIVFLIFAVIAAAISNVEARKEIQSLLIREAIEIDGHLNEEDWGRAQAIDDFVQQTPDEGQHAR